MSVIITNISTHSDLEGPNDYVLKINHKVIGYFRHVRSEGLGECLRKAAEVADRERQ